MNYLSIDNLKELSHSNDSETVIKLLELLVTEDCFQYYPNINFLDLHLKVCFRFQTNTQDMLVKVRNGLLMFPISHIFSNNDMFVWHIFLIWI